MFKKRFFLFIIISFVFTLTVARAEEVYDPPFQISGIVKDIHQDTIDVYLPYINKQVTVSVLSDTLIVNRIDTQAIPQPLSAINVEDLVIVKGILKNDSFCSKNISFLSVSTE